MDKYSIHQFDIYYHDRDGLLKILYKIYDEVLRSDPNWSFFLEEDSEGKESIRLRCSKKYSLTISKYLDSKQIDYKFDDYWKDELEEILQDLDLFCSVFHTSSELAMRRYSEGKKYSSATDHYMYLVGDRFIHSFFNSMAFVNDFGEWQEPILISDICVGRAKYVGRREYYKELLRVRDSLKEVK